MQERIRTIVQQMEGTDGFPSIRADRELDEFLNEAWEIVNISYVQWNGALVRIVVLRYGGRMRA